MGTREHGPPWETLKVEITKVKTLINWSGAYAERSFIVHLCCFAMYRMAQRSREFCLKSFIDVLDVFCKGLKKQRTKYLKSRPRREILQSTKHFLLMQNVVVIKK